MELAIGGATFAATPAEAEALRAALTHHLRRLVTDCPSLPKTVVVKRLLLSPECRWDGKLAGLRPTDKTRIYVLWVGSFSGEVSIADMLRTWKQLENAAQGGGDDQLDLVDDEFVAGLLSEPNRPPC